MIYYYPESIVAYIVFWIMILNSSFIQFHTFLMKLRLKENKNHSIFSIFFSIRLWIIFFAIYSKALYYMNIYLKYIFIYFFIIKMIYNWSNSVLIKPQCVFPEYSRTFFGFYRKTILEYSFFFRFFPKIYIKSKTLVFKQII